MSTFPEIIQKKEPVLVDFFATWCQPCTVLAPILKEVKDVMGDAVHIIKIDVDKNQSLATTYKIQNVPTMMLFKDGQQLWRHSGLISKEELIKIIRAHKN